jgi:hypothetical protein
MNCPPLIGGASRIKAFDRGMGVGLYVSVRSTTKSRCGASRRRLAWIQTRPSRWGIAYSVGLKYNEAWDAFDPVELGASLAWARTELRPAAATAPHPGFCDDSGKFNRSVETVASARRTVSTTSGS